MLVKRLHRYLGLALAAIWLVEALTGVLLVFGCELDEAGTAAPVRALDPAAFSSAVDRLLAPQPGARVTYVLAAGGAPDRYDVLIDVPGAETRYARLDGVGTVLREAPYDSGYPAPGFFFTVRDLHESLYAGDRGLWLVGISGVVLLTNIAFGLKLGWPRRGTWRYALWPSRARTRAAALVAWHRGIALWLALPALLLVASGVMLAIGGPVRDWFDASLESPSARPLSPSAVRHVDLGAAITLALARHPGDSLSLVGMPDEETPWYRMRLLGPGDLRRVFGTTTVYVDSRDGRILGDHDARNAPRGVAFFDSMYPVHTGEAAGLGGRIVALAVALWLAVVTGLGVYLWSLRHARRKADAVDATT